MSDPFIGEIRIFAGNFAPRNWAFCNGQQVPIAQNTALFAIIGTTYGGDGRTTTGLPNLQGRAPMHPGRGPGLSPRSLGESGGTENVTVSVAQMPSHTHTLMVNQDEQGDDNDPAGQFLGANGLYTDPNTAPSNLVSMSSQSMPNVGGSQAHNNLQPFLAINFVIALQGIFPPRN